MTKVANIVPFKELCGLCERISNTKGTDKKKNLLSLFIDKWRQLHDDIHKEDKLSEISKSDTFYPIMRLLLPHLERERDAYGIKEHTLALRYIDILQLGKTSPAGDKLLNYRAPKTARANVGDFASVVFNVMKPRCPEKATMNVAQVNDCLDGIALGHASKDKQMENRNLRQMITNMSATEQKWLVRMILKEMKMGLSQQSVFAVFHQDAEDLFNVKMNLEAVCLMLRDPSVRMHEIEVSLMSPFKPMLADRGAPSKMEKEMHGKSFFIETKYDGERMQLHKKDDAYKFFSRGGNEYTHTFGSNAFDGSLVPYIDNCFRGDIKNVILDGEMVGYNPVTGEIGSKGENFDIKSKDTKDYQTMYCVFDILLLNDTVMSNKTLRDRKDILTDVFTPVKGRIMLSQVSEGHTNVDCASALNDAIENYEEGIMVKDPDSVYKPNTRKGGWYKVKPDYIGGIMDELDLIIVGGYFGKGSRASVVSHFLCAVAEKPKEGEKPSQFLSVGKVGSGYSRDELDHLNSKLNKHYMPYEKKSHPDFLQLAKGYKQRPEVWIHPENSVILQVKAAELVDSDQYKTGCTMRFPRVQKIRDDKDWYDCMTNVELMDLKEKAGGKLAGFLMGDEELDVPKKKRKVVRTVAVRPTVDSKFKAADFSEVTKVSEIFKDKEICVVNGPPSCSKGDLEKKVVEYGGVVVQNPGADTYCVLAHKVALKVRNIISKGLHNVVKTGWFMKCVEQKRLVTWVPADMLHISSETQKLFSMDYDRYGDSYYDDTDEQKLKGVFQAVEKAGAQCMISNEDIATTEMTHFPFDSLLGLFRLCLIYLDVNLVLDDPGTHIRASPLELSALHLRYHGATICDLKNSKLSHVVVHKSDLSRIRSLQELNRKRQKKFQIVTEEWIDASVEAEKLLPEANYHP